jgi:hypothetical protein
LRPTAYLGRRSFFLQLNGSMHAHDFALCRKPKDGNSEDSRVEITKDDISSLTWATIGKSQQFRVHRFDGVEER